MSNRTMIDNYIEGREASAKAQSEYDDAFCAWFEANEESVRAAWAEHLSYVQDSSEHIAMLSASDEALEEFAYEMFGEVQAQVREVAADVESECEFEERTGGVSRTGDE